MLGASSQHKPPAMAPVTIPPEKTEFFTVDGTGTFRLTEEQRTARRVSVTIEKIKIGPNPEYWNFRIPEPATFWGYIQPVQQDAIRDTKQLQYRREALYNADHFELEPVEQLRCLIKDSTLLLFDNLTKVAIAQGLDPAPFGTDRANYLLTNGQPRLIPRDALTAFYYEIQDGFLGLISVIWQGYATPCDNPAGAQVIEGPRSPRRDESGPNSGGGGGTRPQGPPPADRSSDPGSDSPAPPPDSPSGPPSPQPGPPPPPPPGNYFMTVRVQDYTVGAGGACTPRAIREVFYNFNDNNGPGTVQNNPVVANTYQYAIFDRNGQEKLGVASGSLSGCPSEIVSVSQFEY